MADTDQKTESDGTKAKEASDIFVFPSRLRSQAEGGAAHVRFQALNDIEDGPVVHLFVPQGFSVPDAAAYTTMDLGLLGGIDAKGQDVITKGTGVDGLVTQADVVGQATLLGSIVGAKLGSAGIGGSLGGMKALRDGIASNPYTETQYTGSNIRSFGFTFKLVSESAEEADTALAIETFFRNAMYPEESGAFTLKYPDKFKIDFYTGGNKNKYMPHINHCYLVSFNTTYNSTTNAFHEDGQPVEIDIAATFQETRALTRNTLNEIEEAPKKKGSEE
jgi:hypothetical protein